MEAISNCCYTKVIDPGNTGEGICSDCKEHCISIYEERKQEKEEEKENEVLNEHYKLIKKLRKARLDRIQKEDNDHKKGIWDEYLTK